MPQPHTTLQLSTSRLHTTQSQLMMRPPSTTMVMPLLTTTPDSTLPTLRTETVTPPSASTTLPMTTPATSLTSGTRERLTTTPTIQLQPHTTQPQWSTSQLQFTT